MKYPSNMLEVARLQPDYLGFIFYEKSVRYFDGDIPKSLNDVQKVGVFVDAKMDYILSMTKKHDLKFIQLHGNESPNFCAELKLEFNMIKEGQGVDEYQDKKIIKVFSIKDEFDFSVLHPYESVCDYFLFDTKGELPGGNGYTFNWEILKNYPFTKPYFLSGGIGLSEIQKIKAFKKTDASKYCHAIDVNSKFENEAGLKNIEELETFKNELQY